MLYADLHCDFLSYLCDLSSGGTGSTSKPKRTEKFFEAIKKWKKGDCVLQCFALFCKGEEEIDRIEIEKQLALYKYVKTAFEETTGGTAVLSVEGGGASRGELSALRKLFDCGVRVFSPVWNNKNTLSAPHGSAEGLTAKGKAAVAYAIERGVIPDISHASDAAASDVFFLAKERKKTVIASHSLVRALCPNTRNVTDTQIKKIADSGGTVGVCFVRDFIGAQPFAQHVEYLVNKGGEDCVSIGGDFYGTENGYVESPEKMPEFFRVLQKNFTPRQIEKFALANARRVLND